MTLLRVPQASRLAMLLSLGHYGLGEFGVRPAWIAVLDSSIATMAPSPRISPMAPLDAAAKRPNW